MYRKLDVPTADEWLTGLRRETTCQVLRQLGPTPLSNGIILQRLPILKLQVQVQDSFHIIVRAYSFHLLKWCFPNKEINPLSSVAMLVMDASALFCIPILVVNLTAQYKAMAVFPACTCTLAAMHMRTSQVRL